MAKYRVKLVTSLVNVYETTADDIDHVYDQFDLNDVESWTLIDSYPDDDEDVLSVELVDE